MYQIITLHTSNLHSVICLLCLNKSEKKERKWISCDLYSYNEWTRVSWISMSETHKHNSNLKKVAKTCIQFAVCINKFIHMKLKLQNSLIPGLRIWQKHRRMPEMTNTEFQTTITVEIKRNVISKDCTEGIHCACVISHLKMGSRDTDANNADFILTEK